MSAAIALIVDGASLAALAVAARRGVQIARRAALAFCVFDTQALLFIALARGNNRSEQELSWGSIAFVIVAFMCFLDLVMPTTRKKVPRTVRRVWMAYAANCVLLAVAEFCEFRLIFK